MLARALTFLRRRWIVVVIVATVIVVTAPGAVAAARYATRPTVPTATGMSREQVPTELEHVGLTATVIDGGCGNLPSAACHASAQTPAAGTRVERHANVAVTFSPVQVTTPDLTGMRLGQARAAVEKLWLHVDVTYDVEAAAKELAAVSDGHESWLVEAQTEAAGSHVVAGSVVRVSVKAPDVTVPSVAGTTETQAASALRDAGLLLASVTPVGVDQTALVVSGQNPAAGARTPFGTAVALTYNTTVPDVASAKAHKPNEVPAMLEHVGLAAEVSPGAGWDWNLVSVSPAPGTVVPLGTKVTVTYVAPVIEYKVTGNGTRAMITWIAPKSYSISQDTSASVPWVKTFPYSGYDIYGDQSGNFSAQALNGTEISCTLTVDGDVVDQQTSTGRYSIVMCSE